MKQPIKNILRTVCACAVATLFVGANPAQTRALAQQAARITVVAMPVQNAQDAALCTRLLGVRLPGLCVKAPGLCVVFDTQDTSGLYDITVRADASAPGSALSYRAQDANGTLRFCGAGVEVCIAPHKPL